MNATCIGTTADHQALAYLEGALPDREAEQFEEHYFDCPACLAQVQALQAAGRVLAREPSIQLEAVPRGRVLAWPTTAWALAAVAALLVLSVLGIGYYNAQKVRPSLAHNSQAPLVMKGPAPQSTPNPSQNPTPKPPGPSQAQVAVSQLADLAMPVFVTPNLRGESEDARFLAGMKAYSDGNCGDALTTLALVPATVPESRAARFYSGACHMHLGNLTAAKADFGSVANAGDSPEQEAALYYLAQAALLSNDAPGAREYFTRTIELHGDFERRARATLSKLQQPSKLQ
jgi:hypothetical protein